MLMFVFPVGGGAERKEKRRDKSGYLVVKAGQAGAELKSVGLAGDGAHHHQAKFNITVPIPGTERQLLSSSSGSLHHGAKLLRGHSALHRLPQQRVHGGLAT